MGKTFYAIDLDHTLFDTTLYHERYDYELLKVQPADLSGLVYGEGRALIARLREERLPFGIMTFGDPDEQRLKIELSGLAGIPFMVTITPAKAAVMATWKHGDSFAIPTILAGDELHVDEIILVDDKAVAFADLPDGVIGYLYRPTGRPVLEFQDGPVPASVKTIANLTSLLQ